MKRASEVPPVVDSSGLRPVTSVTAPATSSVNGPVSTTNTSALDGSNCNEKRMLLPAALAARSSNSCFKESCVWQSLKRMLNRALASPGMRLTVGLPTSGGELEIGRLEMRAALVQRLIHYGINQRDY